MALTSPRFRWSSRLQKAEQNNPAMRYGEHSHAVRIIQQSMIDLGIDPMVLSVRKYGTPDGIYGSETRGAVRKYQTGKHLVHDGVVGQKTMRALDADLPGAGPKLPPLPSHDRYVVQGLVAARDQLQGGHTNLCWAYSYAMMVSWKRQQSVDARELVARVGTKWLSNFDANKGLSWTETAAFYRAAGMRVEPLMSFPVSEWGEMLRNYGPLTIHGLNNSLGGGHVRMLYGIQGDGNPQTTTMLILDPWHGADYGEAYEKFIAKYEGAGAQAGRTAQIGHF
ncbi:MAG: papain-like cysteine protease family protein [Chromatiaceae bacterium]